jgi:peptidoglycan hydrolase-like protein with peptidoglycan-binding domain
LNLLQNASLDVDGVYGQGTKAAVTKFQQANNLEADGWAGTKTADALRTALLARH